MVHPMAVGVEKETETSEVHAPMCQTNEDPNALAILLVVRAPRKDANGGLRELVWQKKGGQERCKKRKRSTKCTSSPSPLKRKRTMDSLKESNSSISLGSRTNTETCLLDAVESFLHCACFLPTKENLTRLYNYVVNSRFARQLQ